MLRTEPDPTLRVHPESSPPVGTNGQHVEPAHEVPPVAAGRPSFLKAAVLGGLAVVVVAGLAVAGLNARARQAAARDELSTGARGDKPRVLTAVAERAAAHTDQVLPGSAAPLLETAVYARTSGYLRRRLVDIGDHVAEGQLLAEIETPEVDAQLLQARAALAESKATLERNRASEALAKVNLDRAANLVRTSAVSRENYDEADANLKVASATVRVTGATIEANAANVRRLEDLQKFQKVIAPFAGTITARNYDAGALIVADNASARELFHVANTETLRVFADVPQTFATGIRVGQPAPVWRREVPGKEFAGTVARTTAAVDPSTRTLRVEVDVPNPDAALLPGMYLQVRFRLEAPQGLVRVPGAAVVTRAGGTRVAVIDGSGTVHYRPVELGRDYGQVVEVTAGLTGGETLVVRPGDDLPDGAAVEPVPAAAR
jgi:RND family efflux transporter MFP subunit